MLFILLSVLPRLGPADELCDNVQQNRVIRVSSSGKRTKKEWPLELESIWEIVEEELGNDPIKVFMNSRAHPRAARCEHDFVSILKTLGTEQINHCRGPRVATGTDL